MLQYSIIVQVISIFPTIYSTQQKQFAICNHWGLWGHVPLEVFVVSRWWSCSLSDAFPVLTQIRPHCLEETGSPRIRDLPLSIADLHADRCLGMLRAPLFNSSVSLGFWVTPGALWRDGHIGFWFPDSAQFVSFRRNLCSFKYANHIVGVGCAKVVSYWSISGEIYLPTCPGKTHFSSY